MDFLGEGEGACPFLTAESTHEKGGTTLFFQAERERGATIDAAAGAAAAAASALPMLGGGKVSTPMCKLNWCGRSCDRKTESVRKMKPNQIVRRSFVLCVVV